MALRFPYGLDHRGRTAEVPIEEHVRGLIEQVLFTAPGERVNRPDFGSGLQQMIFAPGGDVLATTMQSLVQGALLRWVGDEIAVQRVSVRADESRLDVEVQYLILREQRAVSTVFSQEVTS
ncbi:GPW/gp25 family protein [Haliangium sp.]|uniref:GPW/gp25 family protein n=1 Tax=Haliangium sp. TaxID=2663208 RepID=UPI003D0A1B6C